MSAITNTAFPALLPIKHRERLFLFPRFVRFKIFTAPAEITKSARFGSPKCACSKIARTSFYIIQRSKIHRWQSSSCKGQLCLLCGQRTVWGGHRPLRRFWRAYWSNQRLVPLSKIVRNRPIPAFLRHDCAKLRSDDPDYKSIIRIIICCHAWAHPGYPAFHSKRGKVVGAHTSARGKAKRYSMR